MNEIVKLWNHAELCKHWDEGTFIFDTLSKYTKDNILFTPMKNNKDFGYIAEYESEIIIAFKGTENIKAGISNLKSSTYDDPNDLYDNLFHKGFYESWLPFSDVIIPYLKRCNIDYKTVYFTGHSRGGSLALMSILHTIITHFKGFDDRFVCYNFGAMPVIKTLLPKDIFRCVVMRIVNGNDFAPNLFPHLTHIGGSIKFPKTLYSSKINSHKYSEYTKSMIRNLGNLTTKLTTEDKTTLNDILKRCKF